MASFCSCKPKKGFVPTTFEKIRHHRHHRWKKLQMTKQPTPYSSISVALTLVSPGTPKADKIAIEKLLPNRLKDQFCFRTQDAVNHLEYIRSDRYGDVKL